MDPVGCGRSQPKWTHSSECATPVSFPRISIKTKPASVAFGKPGSWETATHMWVDLQRDATLAGSSDKSRLRRKNARIHLLNVIKG